MTVREFTARTNRFVRGACAALTCVAALATGNAWATDADIVNAAGFEAPAFSTLYLGTGQLEGQINPPGFAQVISPGQWLKSQGGTSTAVVQSSVFAPLGGNQAVRVDRAAGSSDRWAVPVNNQGYPDYPNPAPPEPLQPFICISWDMRVEQTTGPADTFGPFFGVEAYDDDGNPVSLLGSLGVDASNGEVLYQAATTGILTAPGPVVTFGEWNKFAIELDFSTHTYKFFMNNVLLGSQGFVDQANVVGGLNQLSDVDIATFAAAGDAASNALTGTAYFDNFHVMEGRCIPEPSALVLGALAGGNLMFLGRFRRKNNL